MIDLVISDCGKKLDCNSFAVGYLDSVEGDIFAQLKEQRHFVLSKATGSANLRVARVFVTTAIERNVREVDGCRLQERVGGWVGGRGRAGKRQRDIRVTSRPKVNLLSS